MHRVRAVMFALAVLGCCLGTPHIAAADQFCASTAATESCFFKAPSGHISCEFVFDNKTMYCQTFLPDRSVDMDANGVLKVCDEPRGCVGNPPSGEATLEFGQSATRGLFTCQSAPSGVTCTVASGRGFSISSVSITPVG